MRNAGVRIIDKTKASKGPSESMTPNCRTIGREATMRLENPKEVVNEVMRHGAAPRAKAFLAAVRRSPPDRRLSLKCVTRWMTGSTLEMRIRPKARAVVEFIGI